MDVHASESEEEEAVEVGAADGESCSGSQEADSKGREAKGRLQLASIDAQASSSDDKLQELEAEGGKTSEAGGQAENRRNSRT